MKIIGMIGGIGPESTIDYYRRLLEGAQKRNPGGPALQIIINSIDLQKGLDLLGRNQLNELTEYIVPEVIRLHSAGVDFGFLAANSPHIVFGDIARRSPIPLVSIVEATCAEAKARGFKKLGLFGTRFTMHGRFYPDVFTREGLQLIVPTADEQGLKGFDSPGWYAFVAPAKTPAPVIARLNKALVVALEVPAVRERLQQLGNAVPPPAQLSPEFLAQFIRSEIAKWAVPIKASGTVLD